MITALYVVAGLLSLWGAMGPWLRRRRRKAFLLRAMEGKQRVRELEEQVFALSNTVGDRQEAKQRQLNQQIKELRDGKFEDSGFTLAQLTDPILFGNAPPAQKELQELSARKEGLGWLAAGVIVGSGASILAIWTL